MTLTGMKKHVVVLEQAGLVTTEKVGRVRTCKLGKRQLGAERAWIERYRRLWNARFGALDAETNNVRARRIVNRGRDTAGNSQALSAPRGLELKRNFRSAGDLT